MSNPTTLSKTELLLWEGCGTLSIWYYLGWPPPCLHFPDQLLSFPKYYKTLIKFSILFSEDDSLSVVKPSQHPSSWRELSRIPNLWETKKIEKTHAKEKTITRTRQYLRGSAICLRPRSCRDISLLSKKNTKYFYRLEYFLSI